MRKYQILIAWLSCVSSVAGISYLIIGSLAVGGLFLGITVLLFWMLWIIKQINLNAHAESDAQEKVSHAS